MSDKYSSRLIFDKRMNKWNQTQKLVTQEEINSNILDLEDLSHLSDPMTGEIEEVKEEVTAEVTEEIIAEDTEAEATDSQ